MTTLVGVVTSLTTMAPAFATTCRCSGGGRYTYGTRTFIPSEWRLAAVPLVVATVVSLMRAVNPAAASFGTNGFGVNALPPEPTVTVVGRKMYSSR